MIKNTTYFHQLENADLSRQTALLACNIASTSSLDSDYLLEVIQPILTDYGIQLNQVSNIIVNSLFYFDTTFENFINNPDPDDLHSFENNYCTIRYIIYYNYMKVKLDYLDFFSSF